MLNNRKHIDDLIKENLGQSPEIPPNFIWDNIDNALSKDRRQKKQLLFWRSTAAAAVILFISSTVFFLSNTTNNTLSTSIASNQENNNHEIILNYSQSIENNSIQRPSSKHHTPCLKNAKANSQTPIILASNNIITNDLHKSDKINPISLNLFNKAASVDTTTLKEKYKKKIFQPLYTPTSNQEKNKRDVFVGGSISPTYNANQEATLSTNNPSLSSKGSTSFSGGFNISVSGKSRWSFESGVMYNKISQDISDINTSQAYNVDDHNRLYFAPGRENSATNDLKNNLENQQALADIGINQDNESFLPNQITEINQVYEYIEIPLLAKYSIIKGRASVNLVGGLSPNLLLNNSAAISDIKNQSTYSSSSEVKSLTFSSSVGMGIELPITKTVSFSLEPRLKYYLNNINNNHHVQYRPYSFGVFGGIKIEL